ncbi:energy transducer TonB [Mucilaginibacter sp. RS28]|uniref:Energy transducer TonB n=1 Tax=Mucilaginibacter straminoryzae TaxID=2932774 RepID=A0A9X1X5U5_9SPHI|nr:energy transducer TonB [Mucilaginibacter straminoryzae]MCJ8211662.1 energy transducer TonB [Mucilaginibacter straminoryzae]
MRICLFLVILLGFSCSPNKYSGKFRDPANSSASIAAFKSYVAKNLLYPAVARENGVHGLIIASFNVDEKSQIKAVRITKPLFSACDEKVISLLNRYPDKLSVRPGTYSIMVEFMLYIDGKKQYHSTELNNTDKSHLLFTLVKKGSASTGKITIVN